MTNIGTKFSSFDFALFALIQNTATKLATRVAEGDNFFKEIYTAQTSIIRDIVHFPFDPKPRINC